MRLKKDSTAQKLRGAYYTPLQLAEAILPLVVDEKTKSILEPSCGDGVFIDSLANSKILENIKKIVAIDVELSAVTFAKERYSKCKNISILHNDFFDYFLSNKERKFDLVLGNPPYIRYQYLTEKQREIQSQILINSGMKSNKLINSWVGFLVATAQMLSDSGKIALVLPAEILQVAYAEDLRLFLSKELTKITIITFEKLIFPEIEQEVVVFIGEKGGDKKGIRIIQLEDLNDFESLKINEHKYQSIMCVKEKWTKYFVSIDEVDILQSIRNDKRFAMLSEYGKINVGITTGNNSYFSIDSDIEDKYCLADVTIPLIGRSAHAHGIYFTKDDWEKNVKLNKKAKLISFPNIPFSNYSDSHREYISKGELTGQNKGYKCSIRDRWYIVPSIWVPDAFFLRRNNLYPKFVLNVCDAVSTDTMHRIKFNENVAPENILLSYYNSISFAFTEVCGRSYGGGVLEILPRELGNIMVPKINYIDPSLSKSLLKRVDEVIRNNQDIEIALDIVDKELLIKCLGIEPELCSESRKIWKKLQSRRLKRG